MAQKVIWIVNEYNFPDSPQTRQTNLCRRLNESGYDAYIISGSSDNKMGKNRIMENTPLKFVQTNEAKGYIVKTSDYRKGYKRVLVSLQFQHRVWRMRDQLPKPDVIVSDFAGLFGNAFLKWKRKFGTIVIFDVLDLWPEGFVEMGYLRKNCIITKLLYRMEHKSYRDASGIIFSFQGGCDYIVDKGWSTATGGDVDTSQIGYLNNGVDLETLDKQRLQCIYYDPDLETNKFKAIYLGSISEFNELEVLVETARVLKERKEDGIIILVYGYGNQEESLRIMADKYKLNNIVFKGKIEVKYAMNVLSRGDINIFTFASIPLFKYGISPNKLFMYFASGKPVLSTVQPNYDLVSNRRCGLAVSHDPEEIANGIVAFSKMSKSEYNEYSRNCRSVAEEYDYKTLVKTLVYMIEDSDKKERNHGN